jgi:hypothetical protein
MPRARISVIAMKAKASGLAICRVRKAREDRLVEPAGQYLCAAFGNEPPQHIDILGCLLKEPVKDAGAVQRYLDRRVRSGPSGTEVGFLVGLLRHKIKITDRLVVVDGNECTLGMS